MERDFNRSWKKTDQFVPFFMMDIVKGSLDEISRPASSSRSRPGSRVSSVSLSDRSRASSAAAGILVALTPEPGCPQESYGTLESINLSPSSSVDSCFEDVECEPAAGDIKCVESAGTEKHDMDALEEYCSTSAEETGSTLKQIQNPTEDAENIGSPADSEEDCNEAKPFSVDEGTQQENTPVVSGHEHSDEENKDPKLTEAIKKMKKLDKILAKKQQNEREVKKRGQELRKHLWQELQAAIPEGVSERHEEAENTRRFLSLTAPPLDTAGACDANEEVAFTSVFNTQIPPDEYEQAEFHLGKDLASCEESKNFSSSKVDGDRGDLPVNNQGGMKGNKKTQDFIKKNIELAKEAGSQVLLTDDEKKRLAELLTDIEVDGAIDLPGNEESSSQWTVALTAGEGYTPEPNELQQLCDIDSKLQAVLSAEDFSKVCSSLSGSQSCTYQEPVLNLDSSCEVLPGEKALQYTKEKREQENRLKEIEQQLKHLETDPQTPIEQPPHLAQDQLESLLEECIRSQSQLGSASQDKPSDALSEGTEVSHCCWPSSASTYSTPHLPESVLSQLLEEARSSGLLVNHNRAIEDNRDNMCEDPEGDAPGYYLSRALANNSLSEKWRESLAVENESSELQEETTEATGDNEGFYMSRALGKKYQQRSTFLVDPSYCCSANVELSTEADVPSLPVESGIDESQNSM
nr:PREDICTED: fibrous sheath-interacting protein 1 isoform X2 [Latimeria chalumnae]|eukprot:XP_014351820.1 PREDICTED: fibrous sheath-interacting protein 1 isoform X2 [Latimeria chalumnae]